MNLATETTLFYSILNAFLLTITAIIGLIFSKNIIEHPSDKKSKRKELLKLKESLINKIEEQLEKLSNSIQFCNNFISSLERNNDPQRPPKKLAGFELVNIPGMQPDTKQPSVLKSEYEKYKRVYESIKERYQLILECLRKDNYEKAIDSFREIEEVENLKELKDPIIVDKNNSIDLLDKTCLFQIELFPTLFPMLFMFLVFISAILVVLSMFNIKVTSDLYWNQLLMIIMLLIATSGLALYPIIQIRRYFKLMCIGGIKVTLARLKDSMFKEDKYT